MPQIDDMLHFLLYEKGETIIYNSKEKIVLIEDAQNKVNYFNDKIIRTNFEINTGEIIEYQNCTWIVISQIEKTEKSYEARIRKMELNIKVYIDSVLQEIPCIIETSTQSVDEGRYINLPIGNIKVTIPFTDITKKISYDKRFIKMDMPWKVVGFTAEHKGLRYLYCEKDSIDTVNDDMENEIADRWKYEVKHDYKLSVDLESIIINEEDTKQITTTIADTVNNVTTTIENPGLTYNSSDINICTIDDTGLITAITEGNCMIIVTFVGANEIILTQNITIEVQPKPIVHNYETVITGSDNIREFDNSNYTVKLLDNGVEIPTQFNFTIDYLGNDSKIVKLTIVNDNTCNIQANSDGIYGYIKLIATDRNNNNNISDLQIKIRSLW